MKLNHTIAAVAAFLVTLAIPQTASSEVTKLSASEMEAILGKGVCTVCIPGKIECKGTTPGACNPAATAPGAPIPIIFCVNNACAGQKVNPQTTNGKCQGLSLTKDCEVPDFPNQALAQQCITKCEPGIAGICGCLNRDDPHGAGITVSFKDCVATPH